MILFWASHHHTAFCTLYWPSSTLFSALIGTSISCGINITCIFWECYFIYHKITSAFRKCTASVIGNFLDACLLNKEAGLRWVPFKSMKTNDTLWGGVPFFSVIYYTTGVILFIVNFVCCILRNQQDKDVSNMNGFWQAHGLSIVTREGKTNSDIIVLFMRVAFFLVIFCTCWSCLVWDIEWKLWVIKNRNSFLHLLDMFMK